MVGVYCTISIFAEVAGNVSGFRDDGCDGMLYNAELQPRLFLGYTDSLQRRYGACKSREHGVRSVPREEHMLEEYPPHVGFG